MSELQSQLREAFESAGYAVEDVTENRGQVRVVLRTDDAEAAALREVTYGVVGEDDVLALAIEAESVAGGDDVGTVVSFRYRG